MRSPTEQFGGASLRKQIYSVKEIPRQETEEIGDVGVVGGVAPKEGVLPPPIVILKGRGKREGRDGDCRFKINTAEEHVPPNNSLIPIEFKRREEEQGVSLVQRD
jgi:hypothetical protein